MIFLHWKEMKWSKMLGWKIWKFLDWIRNIVNTGLKQLKIRKKWKYWIEVRSLEILKSGNTEQKRGHHLLHISDCWLDKILDSEYLKHISDCWLWEKNWIDGLENVSRSDKNPSIQRESQNHQITKSRSNKALRKSKDLFFFLSQLCSNS